MIELDLSVDYPVLVTAPFAVDQAAPEGFPMRGAVVVDMNPWKVPSGRLGFTFAVRGWGAAWDRTPDFTASVWNGDADVSFRLIRDSDAEVVGWWGAGGGLRFGLLAVDWWDDIGTVGLGGWTGGGAVVGRGDIRGVFSVRAAISMDFDSWTGTVAASDATTTWTYWPGSARISALAGVAFR